jgi:hypothetical protein
MDKVVPEHISHNRDGVYPQTWITIKRAVDKQVAKEDRPARGELSTNAPKRNVRYLGKTNTK